MQQSPSLEAAFATIHESLLQQIHEAPSNWTPPQPARQDPLRYSIRIAPGLRFDAPRADGTVVGWTVKKPLGGGIWNAQPDGEPKGRSPFHEGEIEYRVEASEARRGSYMHERAILALEWWGAQPIGRILHTKILNGIPSSSRAIFVRGEVVETAPGRKLFRPTGIVAKPDEFEEAMGQTWFSKRVRELLKGYRMPPLHSCFEVEPGTVAYDPTDFDAIPHDRVGGDREAERLERICERAAKVLRQRRDGKKRLTPAEAVVLARSILGEGRPEGTGKKQGGRRR